MHAISQHECLSLANGLLLVQMFSQADKLRKRILESQNWKSNANLPNEYLNNRIFRSSPCNWSPPPPYFFIFIFLKLLINPKKLVALSLWFTNYIFRSWQLIFGTSRSRGEHDMHTLPVGCKQIYFCTEYLCSCEWLPNFLIMLSLCLRCFSADCKITALGKSKITWTGRGEKL